MTTPMTSSSSPKGVVEAESNWGLSILGMPSFGGTAVEQLAQVDAATVFEADGAGFEVVKFAIALVQDLRQGSVAQFEVIPATRVGDCDEKGDRRESSDSQRSPSKFLAIHNLPLAVARFAVPFHFQFASANWENREIWVRRRSRFTSTLALTHSGFEGRSLAKAIDVGFYGGIGANIQSQHGGDVIQVGADGDIDDAEAIA